MGLRTSRTSRTSQHLQPHHKAYSVARFRHYFLLVSNGIEPVETHEKHWKHSIERVRCSSVSLRSRLQPCAPMSCKQYDSFDTATPPFNAAFTSSGWFTIGVFIGLLLRQSGARTKHQGRCVDVGGQQEQMPVVYGVWRGRTCSKNREWECDSCFARTETP